MALYTVQSVIDKARDLIEEANDVNVVTQDRLIKLTSDAQKWVSAESGCYQAWGSVTLLANTTRYTPPTNASAVLDIEYDYGTDIGVRSLTRVEPGAVPHSPDNEKPYFWCYRGNYVSIYPSMPVVPDTATVSVLTAQIPAVLTALTESLVIPDEFQIVVPYYVAKEVAVKDNQMQKASWLVQEIMRLTREGIAQYSNKGTVGTSMSGGTSGGAS